MLGTFGVGTVGTPHAAKPQWAIKWGSLSKAGGVASEHPLRAAGSVDTSASTVWCSTFTGWPAAMRSATSPLFTPTVKGGGRL